jgi:hypothetical protein
MCRLALDRHRTLKERSHQEHRYRIHARYGFGWAGNAMSTEELSEQRILVGHVRTIAKILYGMGAVSLGIVSARIFGLTSIKALGLAAPLSHVWIIYVSSTVAHVFFGHMLLLAIGKNWDGGEVGADFGKRVFDSVRSEDSIFLRGLMPRAVPWIEGSRIFRMHWTDPTTTLFCGLLLLSWVAILPWRVAGGLEWTGGPRYVAAHFVLGVLLIAINWLVGGQWLVMLSHFPYSDNEELRMVGSFPFWYSRLIVVYFVMLCILLVLGPLILVEII